MSIRDKPKRELKRIKRSELGLKKNRKRGRKIQNTHTLIKENIAQITKKLKNTH